MLSILGAITDHEWVVGLAAMVIVVGFILRLLGVFTPEEVSWYDLANFIGSVIIAFSWGRRYAAGER